MNNEETIFMQPQNNNNETEHTQNVKATEKKSDKAKKVVATTAASVMGGVVGGGTTYAATEMLHDKEADEQKPEGEVQATEEPVAKEPQKVEHAETQKEEVAVKVDNDESAEPDYTNHAGADPVTPNPEVQATVDEAIDSNANTNEVQVLGVYETQGENGQTMQAAMLTNGEEVAAVVDLEGDGVADVLLVDENHNQQIDEGEVYDLSNENVQMSIFQDAYQAQQQMQQEQDTYTYNVNDDQQDSNCGVDFQNM